MTRSPPTPPTGWQMFNLFAVLAYLVASAAWQNTEIFSLMASTADIVAKYPQLHDEIAKLDTDITALVALVTSLKGTPEQQAAIDATLASMQSDAAAAAVADTSAQDTLNPPAA